MTTDPILDFGFITDPRPLLGLHGRARVGKDTAAEFLVDECGYARTLALADGVRDCLEALDPYLWGGARLVEAVETLGWDVLKRDRLHMREARRLMQYFGTEVGRDLVSPTLWTDLAVHRLKERRDEGPAIITDVRFADEADWVRSLGGTVLGIRRPDARSFLDQKAAAHASEVEAVKCETWVDNDADLETFHDRIVAFGTSLAGSMPTDFPAPQKPKVQELDAIVHEALYALNPYLYGNIRLVEVVETIGWEKARRDPLHGREVSRLTERLIDGVQAILDPVLRPPESLQSPEAVGARIRALLNSSAAEEA